MEMGTEKQGGRGGGRHSQWGDVWLRFRRNRVAMVSLVLLILIILVTVGSEVIAPYAYGKIDLPERFQFPSALHWFGTDNLGRDILSRVLVGGKISLLVAFLSVGLAAVAGSLLGAAAGYFGGKWELLIMKCTDVLMAIPAFLLAVSVSVALGTGVLETALAVGLCNIPRFVRLMRAETLAVKGREFIEAARSCGSSHGRIILRHVFPNALSSTIVNVTLGVSTAILQISGLSFVGLGVQPPNPEWGSMLASGRTYIRDFWPMVVFPGIAIVVTLILFNLVGDGLRDAMDPKLKR
ncbi:putative peptide transporter permease subunit: membrane component of ABC superfamily [uncultured Eubacteriales bacterium]|uniref:Putative peptide transporter permease subunit: membrane component of ABC superfamily n=1 Tax=uncultured Eubacteriales bacterium TaxID=172733 RepID=A0A212JFD6_9FIRM|nr:putative peptide transporter permease subunit: membrane component of ABC superfamily [uncultured Eubacteriales bacterium]